MVRSGRDTKMWVALTAIAVLTSSACARQMQSWVRKVKSCPVTIPGVRRARRLAPLAALATVTAVALTGCSDAARRDDSAGQVTPSASGAFDAGRLPQAHPSQTGVSCALPTTAAGFGRWLNGDGLFVEVTLPTPYVTPVITTSNGGVNANREEFDFTAADEVRAFGGTVPHTFGIDAPDLGLTAGQQYVLAVFPVPTMLAQNGGVAYAASGGTTAVLKVDAGTVSQTCVGETSAAPGSATLSALEPLLAQAAASVPPPPPAPFTATPTAS